MGTARRGQGGPFSIPWPVLAFVYHLCHLEENRYLMVTLYMWFHFFLLFKKKKEREMVSCMHSSATGFSQLPVSTPLLHACSRLRGKAGYSSQEIHQIPPSGAHSFHPC